MKLRGTYLVGKDGATITWSDGSEQTLAPQSTVRMDSDDPRRQPLRIRGRLIRLSLADQRPRYEAPQLRPEP